MHVLLLLTSSLQCGGSLIRDRLEYREVLVSGAVGKLPVLICILSLLASSRAGRGS